MAQCGPKVSTATLVVDSPVVVTFLCECGDEGHAWTSTSYRATANFTDESGKYPEDARL